MTSLFSGTNLRSIKSSNRALIIKILSTLGPVSRIELSRITGLSKMAITNIVGELINRSVVVEKGTDTAASGRKPILLDLNPDWFYAAGVYISRDHVEAVLLDLKGATRQFSGLELSFDETPKTLMEKITFVLKDIITPVKDSQDKILGIGVASIGPIDSEKGILLEPPNFHNMRHIHLKEFLEDRFNKRIFVDNDMNAAALAEKYYGKAVDTSNFVYIGITNGIGAGIVTNNVLYKGDKGFAGEIGHTTIDINGSKCPCGNVGCLELYASIPEIVKQAREALALGFDSILKAYPLPSWKDIVEHAAAGDSLCLKLMDRLCTYVSIGIVNVANSFDPQKIILGHDVALAGDLITERLQSAVKQRAMGSKFKDIKVEISKFIEKSPSIGSAILVFDSLFNGELDEYIEKGAG